MGGRFGMSPLSEGSAILGSLRGLPAGWCLRRIDGSAFILANPLSRVRNSSAAAKRGIAEGRVPVPRGDELGAIEELGAVEERAGKIGAVEHRLEEIRPLHSGTRQVRIAALRSAQIGAAQVRTGKIAAAQVEAAQRGRR